MTQTKTRTFGRTMMLSMVALLLVGGATAMAPVASANPILPQVDCTSVRWSVLGLYVQFCPGAIPLPEID